MKHLLPYFSFLIFSFSFSQEDSKLLLQDIQNRQININKASMISLNSWAVSNISYGLVANFNSTGEAKYFHQMNAIWNVVNLGIGIPGIINAYKEKPSRNLLQLNQYQHKLEKVYLVNTGLDLAYITSGLALRALGEGKPIEIKHRLKGYGNSLIMQGGYLLIHDIAVLFMLRSNKNLFEKSWRNVKLKSFGTNLILEFH